MRELWRGEAILAEHRSDGLTFPSILARTSEALDALAAELGLGSFESERATSALMPREVRLRRLAPTTPGATIAIVGGIERFEETSLLVSFELRQVGSEQPAAAISILADHLETAHAKVFPWTSRTVAATAALRAAPSVPHADAPGRPQPSAMIGEATAQGVFQAGEADAFGRIRVASLLRRALDSGSWPFPAPSNAGGPLPTHVEGWLRVFAHPTPGDRYVAVSDIVEMAGGRWRETRVLWPPSGSTVWAQLDLACAWIDPATGEPTAPPAAAAKALAEAATPGKARPRA